MKKLMIVAICAAVVGGYSLNADAGEPSKSLLGKMGFKSNVQKMTDAQGNQVRGKAGFAFAGGSGTAVLFPNSQNTFYFGVGAGANGAYASGTNTSYVSRFSFFNPGVSIATGSSSAVAGGF